MKRRNTPRDWKVQITFVPFDSESERDGAYRNWVRAFWKGEIKRQEKERRHEHDKEEI